MDKSSNFNKETNNNITDDKKKKKYMIKGN